MSFINGNEILEYKYMGRDNSLNECSKVSIYYDYTGIENWALGKWRTNNKNTKEYKAFIEGRMRFIDIEFVKTKAHSGDLLNERADKLAKESLTE